MIKAGESPKLVAAGQHIGRRSVRFVLIEPSHPGNVGSAARALQVMGFDRLVVVNPRFPEVNTHPEAIAFASSASRVLNACQIVPSLADALIGARMTVAVSAAGREFAAPPESPRVIARDAAGLLGRLGVIDQVVTEQAVSDPSAAQGINDQSPVALVFGTERVGFSIEQAQQCGRLCTIDADPGYSSLNLAQALQIMAYEMRQAMPGVADPAPATVAETVLHPDDLPAAHDRVEGMLAHLEQSLISIGYLDPARPRRLMPRLRRLFGRAVLSTKEVDILRGICQKMTQAEHSKSRK